MKVNLYDTWTYLELNELEQKRFKDFENGLKIYTGVREDGFQFSKAYKLGVWDGITPLYDMDNHRLPTGLRDQLDTFIKEYQNKHQDFVVEMQDNRTDRFLTRDMVETPLKVTKGGEELTLRDYQEGSVLAGVEEMTGVLYLAVNSGKTLTSVGLINTFKPYLENKERICYIVPSKQIFTQAVNTMTDQYGSDVGFIGDGKFKDGKVMVILMPSLVSKLKDPTKGKEVKLSGKKREIQLFVEEVLPNFDGKVNLNSMLRSYIRNYERTYKMTSARTNIVSYLESLAAENMSDARLKQELNGWRAKYEKIIRKLVGDKLDVYNNTLELVKNTALLIVDEGHHSKASTWYDTIMQFDNTPYKFAMTGSIDYKDKLTTQRLWAIFHKVIYKVENNEMVERGISSRPTIQFATIREPKTYDLTDAYGIVQRKQLANEKDYAKAYQAGIVDNELRNRVISNFAVASAKSGKPTLITITRMEHGNALKDKITELGGKVEFINGEQTTEERAEILDRMRKGISEIMIASSMVDEGMDIDIFRVLIMAAGGKSKRQTIQRVGRVLRKKKEDNTSIVLDFVDRTNTYLYNQSKERRKTYEAEQFEIRDIN
jgi:superfamily II DNA or RNA helicase